MKLYRYFHQYLDTRHKCLSGLFLKVRFQQAIHIIPNRSPCLGYQIVSSRFFLHKFKVTMTGVVAAHIAQFRLQPISIGHTRGNTALYQRIQFI